MYSSFPQFVLGFHGCDKALGKAIIAGECSLAPSKNSYDWLGSGIYFWENASGRAMDWARECLSNPKITRGKVTEPFVVGALIDLGYCLNLTDVEYCQLLKETHSFLIETYARADLQMPSNAESSKKLDCLVINAAIDNNRDIHHPDFDTVRGAFIEGAPIYPGATLYSKTHIQVCVRNPNCIKGYFNPLEPIPDFRIP